MTDAILTLLGTSHIAEESVKDIINSIETIDPDLVAVELDKGRLQGLLQDKATTLPISMIFNIGVWGYLLAVVGQYVQKKLGNIIGAKPGMDMLTGVKYAKIKGKKIALIDQPIQITLKKVSKLFSWKDKWNLCYDIFEGIFFKKRAERKMKKIMGTLDLQKVPKKEVVTKMISLLEKRYPGLHKAVVEQRNEVMSKNIKGLLKQFPNQKILVIVGAGHIKGMNTILKEELQKKVDV